MASFVLGEGVADWPLYGVFFAAGGADGRTGGEGIAEDFLGEHVDVELGVAKGVEGVAVCGGDVVSVAEGGADAGDAVEEGGDDGCGEGLVGFGEGMGLSPGTEGGHRGRRRVSQLRYVCISFLEWELDVIVVTGDNW